MKKITLLLLLLLITLIGHAQSFQWAQQLAGTGSFNVSVKKTIARANGFVAIGSFYGEVDFDPTVTGSHIITSQGVDGFFALYDTGGNLVSIHTSDLAGDDEYLTGELYGYPTLYNVIHKIGNGFKVLRFDITSLTLEISIGMETGLYTCTGGSLINVVLTKSGPPRIAGTFTGSITIGSTTLTSAGNQDVFVAYFSSNYNPISVVRHGGSDYEAVFGIIKDSSNNTFITGNFMGVGEFKNAAGGSIIKTSNGERDIFIAQLDASGYAISQETTSTFGGVESESATCAVYDMTNNKIIIGGYYHDTVDFAPSTASVTNLTASSVFGDGFVAQYSVVLPGVTFSIFACDWAKSIGGAYNDYINGVSSDGTNVYYAARLESITNGSATLTGAYLSADGSNVAYGGLFLPSDQITLNHPVAIDTGYNATYICGPFNSTVDFDPGAGTASISAISGGSNSFIVKMGECDLSASISGTVNMPACVGSPVTLSVPASTNLNNNNYWAWYSDSCGGNLIGQGSTITVSPGVATSYYVRGEGGCAPASGCRTVNVLVSTVIPDGDTVLNGTTLTATENAPGTLYQWLDCDNENALIFGADDQSFTPSVSGNYAVRLTNGGCQTTSDCTEVTVLGTDGFARSGLKIYPNPANDYFTIEAGVAIEKVILYNTLGQRIKVFAKNDRIYDLDRLPSGIYIVEAITGQGTAVTKIIKQ